MPEYPRYFCHGSAYYAPTAYYRVEGPKKSVCVEPAKAEEQQIDWPIEYFLREPREGRPSFLEVTWETIDEALKKWHRSRAPKNPPDLD